MRSFYIPILINLWLIYRVALCQHISHPISVKSVVYPNWPASFITQSHLHLSNVYRSYNKLFPYYDTSIATQVVDFIPEYELVDDIAWSELKDAYAKSRWHYFSGNIMSDQLTNIRQTLQLPEVVHKLILDEEIRQKLTANLWVGQEGVVATAHYDSVYNVYIQYAGIKVFRLLPPRAVHGLSIHGRMHPYACQSRYRNITTGDAFSRQPFCVAVASSRTSPCRTSNINDISSSTGELYDKESVQEVTLHPGDVLVIPPFWTHEVEALSPALSVSLWWDAAELDIMDEIYALPLPFDDSWDADTLVQVASVFCTELVQAVVREVRAELTRTHSSGELLQLLPGLHEQFSMDSIARLLKIRYLDDWHSRAADTVVGTAGEAEEELIGAEQPQLHCCNAHNRGIESSMHVVDLAALQQSTKARALVFARRFLSTSNYAPVSSIHTQRTELDDEEGLSVRENQLAVLSIKLCDYVEDVFREVAEMAAERVKFSSSSSGGVLGRAVALLLSWVECVVY